MKQWIVFFFIECYPAGGMEDLLGSYDTQREVYDALYKERPGNYQVVDRDTWEIVEEGHIEELDFSLWGEWGWEEDTMSAET